MLLLARYARSAAIMLPELAAPYIHFTMETVNDDKLAFLDIAVSRERPHHHQHVTEVYAH